MSRTEEALTPQFRSQLGALELSAFMNIAKREGGGNLGVYGNSDPETGTSEEAQWECLSDVWALEGRLSAHPPTRAPTPPGFFSVRRQGPPLLLFEGTKMAIKAGARHD